MTKLKFAGILKLILPAIVIITFMQCMHDEYDFSKLDDEMEIKAGVLTPIAYGSLTLDDLISEFDSSSYISSDADGLLMITYEDSLFSYLADELLEIPSQDFIEFFIESDFNIPPGWGVGETISIDRTKSFPFTFSHGEKLDSMILDEGSMVFDISSEFRHTGTIDVTFPNIRLNGTPFTRQIPIDVADGTFTYNEPFVLDGYTIYLSDSVGTDTMFIPVEFNIELINSGAGMNAGEQIDITANIQDMNFEAIFGYVGDYELITQTGDIDLGFFENTIDGYVRFENPQVNFNITNSYGVPAGVSITRMVGFNGSDSIQMTFNEDLDTFGYAYPRLSDYLNNDIHKDTTISINNTNSNVADFLSFLPSSLEYSLSATSNPPGSNSYNFVSDGSKMDVGFEFVLPLWFKADSFAFEDTIDMNLEEIEEEGDIIDRVSVMLEVSNGLPLDIDFQIYFVDENYNHVDTLFANEVRPVISHAIIDETTNEVIAPGVKPSLIEFEGDEIMDLSTVRYGIIDAGLKTPSDSNNELISVKFMDDYSIDFNISVGIDVKANTNDL